MTAATANMSTIVSLSLSLSLSASPPNHTIVVFPWLTPFHGLFSFFPYLVFFSCLFVGHRTAFVYVFQPFDSNQKPPTRLVSRHKCLKIETAQCDRGCSQKFFTCRTDAKSLCMCVCVCVWQACAPLWSQECGTSMFSTGICASVSDDLKPRETIAPTSQSNHTFAHTNRHLGGQTCCTGLLQLTRCFLKYPTCGRVLHIHGHSDRAGRLQQYLPMVRGPELPQQHPQQVPHQLRPDAGKSASRCVFALPMNSIYFGSGNLWVWTWVSFPLKPLEPYSCGPEH